MSQFMRNTTVVRLIESSVSRYAAWRTYITGCSVLAVSLAVARLLFSGEVSHG
jgi:hypothetical protein